MQLGGSHDTLRSPWSVITIRANTAAPTCYVLTMDEVKAFAHRGVNAAGKVSFWLHPKSYDQSVFEEAWHRLGNPSGNLPLPANGRRPSNSGVTLDSPEPPLG